jgi:hypothetical protein
MPVFRLTMGFRYAPNLFGTLYDSSHVAYAVKFWCARMCVYSCIIQQITWVILCVCTLRQILSKHAMAQHKLHVQFYFYLRFCTYNGSTP